MSFDAMAWAAEQKCNSAGEKLVLMMLASHTNSHTRQCNPSHKLLAGECCMGQSTLKRNLASLERSGLLKIIAKSASGRSLPNQYELGGPNRATGSPNWTGRSPNPTPLRGPNRATKHEETGIETALIGSGSADATRAYLDKESARIIQKPSNETMLKLADVVSKLRKA